MKKVLMAAAAVACFGTVAMAGPNAGGTLIVVSSGEVFCADDGSYCGSLQLGDCAEAGALSQIDGAQATPVVLHVMAAFADAANPALAGITFGIGYNDAEVFLAGTGGCGDFELATDDWPAPGSGTAITWNTARTDNVNSVYWIAAYNYYGNPNTLDLTAHPTQGANFADDAIPANVDPIAGLGSFGFDTMGNNPCPDVGSVPGACCAPDGSCEVVTEAECQGMYLGDGTVCDPNDCPQPRTGACCVDDLCAVRTQMECDAAGGDYQGDDAPCEPETCAPTPTIDSSWGSVKNIYR